MTRLVLYMAHPISPSADELAAAPYERVERGVGEDMRYPLSESERRALVTDRNVERALRWLRWLRRSFPRVTFVAPWIAAILSGEDDADPAQREAGLVDCEATVARIGAIVLVGGRVSSGMARELAYATIAFDLTALGAEPPAELYQPAAGDPPDLVVLAGGAA